MKDTTACCAACSLDVPDRLADDPTDCRRSLRTEIADGDSVQELNHDFGGDSGGA